MISRFKEHTFLQIFRIIVRKILDKIIKIILNFTNLLDIKEDFEEFYPEVNFFYDYKKKEEIKEFYNENLFLKYQVLIESQKIIEHKFDLLGSGIKNLGNNIKWNKDFKTGYVWGNKFYKDIKIIELNNNADVKIPWELSRFQHLFVLGKAYWITDNKKYYNEFKFQIKDWIDSNPYCMSVNWTCTMDVAIRAVNWIYAYFHFEDLIEKDVKFKNIFFKKLYQHGNFIYKNLENHRKFKGNHYLSNLVGLIYLGIFFKSSNKKLKKDKKWLKFGLNEFKKEMMIQINKDGTNYESSTNYHRLVSELVLYTFLICDKNNIKIEKKYKDVIEKMHEFLMNITKPNEISPLIGDVDNGRLVILSNYYNWNKRELNNTLGIAGLYFKRDDFKYFGKKYQEENLWCFGKVIDEKLKVPYLKSMAYAQGGYYLLRNDRIYCLIRCGELSLKGEGVHSHNDQLSFELNINGEDIFIDPGSYTYTANYKERNRFRSTNFHNTLVIKNYEQNDFNEKELFKMKEQTFSKCLKFNINEFEGEHSGYKNKIGLKHKRNFKLKEKSIIIRDSLDRIILNTELNFILHPSLNFYSDKNIIFLRGKKTLVRIKNIFHYELIETSVSFSYGEIQKSKCLKVFDIKKPIEIEIVKG